MITIAIRNTALFLLISSTTIYGPHKINLLFTHYVLFCVDAQFVKL